MQSQKLEVESGGEAVKPKEVVADRDGRGVGEGGRWEGGLGSLGGNDTFVEA
jgi:hypothetical protein